MRLFLVLVSWTLLVLMPSHARAQDGDDAQDAAAAEALFQQGRDAMAESDFETACRMFAESLALDAAVGTVMNLAVCEEQRGHYTAAWERWHQALRLLSPGDDRVLFADQKLESVAQKLAHLTLRLAPGAPSGVTVRRDGVALGAASLGQELPADPGKHVVTVESNQHEKKTYTFSLDSGDHKELVINVGRLKPVEKEVNPKNVQARRIGGYTALGVGVLGAGTALVTGLLLPAAHRQVEDTCPDMVCDDKDQALSEVRTLLAINTAGFVIAGVGLATGSVLLLTLPRNPNKSAQKDRAQRREKDKKDRAESAHAERAFEPNGAYARSVKIAPWGTGLQVFGEF